MYDTLYSDRFDGLPSRVLKTKASLKQLKRGLNLFMAFINSRDIARTLRIPYFRLFSGVLASGRKRTIMLAYTANSFKAVQAATENGDVGKGILPVGQITGLIHDEPSVSELINRMVAEAEEVYKRIGAMME